MISTKDVQRILADYHVPVLSGYGLGICRMAAIDMAHPILGLAVESALPSNDDLRALQSYQEFSIRKWYNQTWQEKLLAMPYPSDEGANTLLFVCGWRDEPGTWGFRRISWTEGPTFVVGTGKDMKKRFTSLLDVILYVQKDDGGKFKEWRKAHAEIFDKTTRASQPA